MIKVGLTGGIGSGKSLVASMLSILGIPVYNSDERAKYLMVHDVDVKESLIALFGADAFNDKGILNRKHIAGKVFNNQDLLDKLNAIVHPAVGKDYEHWLSQHSDSPYTIKEAALIFEADIYKQLDYIITVVAPENERIARVVNRDGITESDVRARISRQWSDAQRIPLSDFVLVNDGTKPLIRQVMEVHNLLLENAQTRA